MRFAADPQARSQLARLEELRRDHRVAQARQKELLDCSSLLRKADTDALDRRLVDIRQGDRERPGGGSIAASWPSRSSTATSPATASRRLLLLIGLVMLGVALKGFFMFLQEVLVADVMQLTLFDIRNLLLPPDDEPGPGQLLRPGLLRADGAVHQRHGLVRPGPQHADEQADPRADADRDLPGLGAPGSTGG